MYLSLPRLNATGWSGNQRYFSFPEDKGREMKGGICKEWTRKKGGMEDHDQDKEGIKM